LQSIWLFIAELAGKDLDFITIFKFIFYYSPIMVPLVLPLSILLASIMTFGSFAENYEFAAMKSGGISLKRAMKFLVLCTMIFSVVAFLFANNIIPEAQYRFVNLRKNILQTKPAMAIGEGQFNEIGTTTTIKVDKKSGENGEFLEGITMHMKKGEFGPISTVIKAEKGVLKSDETTNLLQLDLLDGNYYEDIQPQKMEERERLPFAKSSFKKYTINIDLAKLNGASEESGEIINAFNMLTMGELKYTIDSLQLNYKKDVISYSDNIDKNSQSLTDVLQESKPQNSVVANLKPKPTFDLLELLPKDKQAVIFEVAKSNISNTIFSLDGYNVDLDMKKKYINDFWIAYYDKILVAYSCLLMFFIGAPLGAIIRKGGLGLPIVFAVLIFIVFNFANTFGKKLAGQDAIHPFIGVAAGALILTPFAILFTYRATNDMGLTIDLDWLINPIKNIFSKLINNKQTIQQTNEQ
jgi:lipopolysaccharide export system permease protein